MLIFGLAEKYLPTLDLILTVLGIQVFAAIGILSEIGADMFVFPSSKHLCSWAGLTPQNNESAGKKKTTRISRAGAYIKPLLVQCALCAIRKKSNPEIRSRYLNLKKRRGHKKAIIAIARMLLTAIYNMIKRNEKYNPALYRKADTLPRNREVSVNEAIYILQRQGYLVTAPQSALYPLISNFSVTPVTCFRVPLFTRVTFNLNTSFALRIADKTDLQIGVDFSSE